MKQTGLRWARLCVTTTTTLLAAHATQAAQTHILQPGETLASLARHYRVSVKEIIAANHFAHPDSLLDGQKVFIPDAKRVEWAPYLNRAATIKGDRITLRTGPGTDFTRVEMYDQGTSLTITADQNGWMQVRMADGNTGWILQEYLQIAGSKGQVASQPAPAKPHKPTPSAPALARDAEPTRKHRATTAKASHSHAVAKKQTEEQRPKEVARATRRKQSWTRQVAVAPRPRVEARATTRHERRASEAPRPTTEQPISLANNDSNDNTVARSAYAYRGTPYRWGGSSRGGFDCSGFTSYLYRQKGVSLPHSAQSQFSMGKHVSRDGLKPGDLVFFETVRKGISHVGVYVGEGKFIHASSRRSGGVRMDNLSTSYYSNRFRGARRY